MGRRTIFSSHVNWTYFTKLISDLSLLMNLVSLLTTYNKQVYDLLVEFMVYIAKTLEYKLCLADWKKDLEKFYLSKRCKCVFNGPPIILLVQCCLF